MNFVWTAEATEQARLLFVVEGKSATKTAEIMGGGLTRKAILSKSERIGWAKERDPAHAIANRSKNLIVTTAVFWTPEKIAQAVALGKRHLSAMEIAHAVGATSQASVRSIFARIGFSRPRLNVRRRPVRVEAPVVIVGKPLEALGRDDCRYPLGDPQHADFAFCGAPKGRGSYCHGHANLCYAEGA